jgi:hypothetical protein
VQPLRTQRLLGAQPVLLRRSVLKASREPELNASAAISRCLAGALSRGAHLSQTLLVMQITLAMNVSSY